jgi:hypothetical protein
VLPIPEKEIHESADAGLAVFLRAYGSVPSTPTAPDT